jgi:hypothetical protein
MFALDAAARFDAPEQLIQPKPAIAWLSSSSPLIILDAVRAGWVNSGVRRLKLNDCGQSSEINQMGRRISACRFRPLMIESLCAE